MRYRKKPVELEAWQVGSDEPMPEWVHGEYVGNGLGDIYQYIMLTTEVGEMRAPVGCYIMHMPDDSARIVPPGIFEQAYEVVE